MTPRTISSWFMAAMAAFALLLAACGGGGDDDDPSTPASGGDNGTVRDPMLNVPQDQLNKFGVQPAGAEFTVGPNHFVFGITNVEQTGPVGATAARATFYDLSDQNHPKPVFAADATPSRPGVGPVTEHIHADGSVHMHGGEDQRRAGFYVDVNFDHAGFWGLVVEATLLDGTKGVANIGFQVFDKPRIPAPGMDAPRSDNLTKADVADIHEIDSGDPPNDMHDVKIKDAIAAHRPLVIVFSTPAFCTSLFCGPVNQEVESLQEQYRDKVDFVHIEIWRNFETKELNPTAREWLLRKDGGLSEPFVYVVDKNGVIYDRWEGPVAKNIMEPAVKEVAEGKTWADKS
ncbi:MAG: TlpA family protein disulfide reductase [Hyphomicrobiales bacterium]